MTNSQDTSEIVKKIDAYIKDNAQGVSIQDVAKQFSISRYDANHILGILIGMGKIGTKKIGPVKLHYYLEKKQKGGQANSE